MHVFVTGATGFIGLPVVGELVAAGHSVLGLARSQAGADAVSQAGATAHRGSLEDLDSLRQGAAAADAVIHLAFVHDWSNFLASCETDRRAIEALGGVLAGTEKPLIVTGGLGGLAGPGETATEDDVIPPDFPFPRVSEQTALALRGVSAAVMRLPQVHDRRKQGIITPMIDIARQTGVSAYVGEGRNRLSAAHVSDVARLYRLALEGHRAGARYHAVAEEGVTTREVAETLGRVLDLPVRSVAAEAAAEQFGHFAIFASLELAGSSYKTRQWLGWEPKGPGLIEDLSNLELSEETKAA